jgi:hypothetical protein
MDPTDLSALVDGGKDTVALACTDFHRSPLGEAGGTCVASFLDCLGCPNARALPHQLPIQLGLHGRLTDLRHHIAAPEWSARYATATRQLDDIIRHYTASERDRARTAITSAHLQIIDDLIEGRWDLR